MSNVITAPQGKIYFKNDLIECDGSLFEDTDALVYTLTHHPEFFGWEGLTVREVVELDSGFYRYQINLVWDDCDDNTCEHASENETCPVIEEFVEVGYKNYTSLIKY